MFPFVIVYSNYETESLACAAAVADTVCKAISNVGTLRAIHQSLLPLALQPERRFYWLRIFPCVLRFLSAPVTIEAENVSVQAALALITATIEQVF